VFVGNNAETFESVVRHAAQHPAGIRFRIFFGCAGWAPGQLEGEIERGDWLIHPACAALIFSDDPYDIWDQALSAAHAAHRILPFMPENPEWN
jgi:putative transcriptional regulator